MRQDILATIRSTDPDLLREIVRQDQDSPTLELLDWDVKRLSTKGTINPDGLFLFSGHGRDVTGVKNWSVVLKLLTPNDLDIRNTWYWKRELLVAQSGLTANLRGRLVAPRYYAATEHDGRGWLWMEHIAPNTPPRWTQDNYAFAAYQIGRSSGAYLTNLAMPDYPWLTRDNARLVSDGFAPHRAWDNPYVRQSFSDRLRGRVMQLWDDREQFLNTIYYLPQTLSHFDFSRRNLFIRTGQDGRDEVVAVDWALTGFGPVGADLYSLTGTSAMLFELEPAALPSVDAATFEAYVAGLREAGWNGDPSSVRLAYTAYLSVFIGVSSPGLLAYFTSAENLPMLPAWFDCSPEEYASAMAATCEFVLDRADEARELMSRLA